MRLPPLAPRRPHVLVAHGDAREDDWYWLRERADPDVIAYLEAENAYTDEVLAPLRSFREALFEEIRSRVRESDVGPPARNGTWWYYGRTVEGQQYPIHCRRRDPERRLSAVEVLALVEQGAPGEEVLLDDNKLAAGSEYFSLGVFDLNPDQTCAAYAVDLTGGELHVLRFRDLASGTDLPDEISGVYYSSAWSADGDMFWYTRPDDDLRPWQVWRHHLGHPAEDDVLVFEEPDDRFFVEVGVTRSERFIVDLVRQQDDLGGPFPRRPPPHGAAPGGRGPPPGGGVQRRPCGAARRRGRVPHLGQRRGGGELRPAPRTGR